MKHGGSSRRRQKMAQRLQTGVVRDEPVSGGGISTTSAPEGSQEGEGLGANLSRDKAIMAGAIALGAGIALAGL